MSKNGSGVESAQGLGTTGGFDSLLQNKATLSTAPHIDDELDPAKQPSAMELDARTRYYMDLAESTDLDKEASQNVEFVRDVRLKMIATQGSILD